MAYRAVRGGPIAWRFDAKAGRPGPDPWTRVLGSACAEPLAHLPSRCAYSALPKGCRSGDPKVGHSRESPPATSDRDLR